MTWDRRSGTTYRARNAVQQLTSRGIVLPDSIASAVAVLDRVAASGPREPDTVAVRNAIVDGADSDVINGLLLAELAYTRLRSEHAQAILIAAQRVLGAILDERANLHAALNMRAEHAIARLKNVAALDGASLEELVRAGRHDDAQALAEVEVVGAELVALYETRDSYLTPGGLDAARAGQFDCTQFRDPRVAARHHRDDLGVVGNYLAALRHGAALWFPTSEEALAAAAPLYQEWEQQAARVADRQRQVGGFTAF
ncbi:hypothetical protein JRC04_06900 [Mycolicibacterium sp. S2-37]|uniref:hypothetical protein n=1 Tax=Mycolicibacterium sp. S2-37 TaxID=2810297 RepID=UPI001A9454D2|nr:hypothetical protein [Mycolicibacterium sp. S2-37]MBO0677188.1 hypothetical protein [Mycolicibacterium sp. S2-37]